MKLDESFPLVLKELEKEGGVSLEDIKTAIETAFLSAYKKKFGMKDNVQIKINNILTEIIITAKKRIVEIVEDPSKEATLEEALEINPEAQIDDEISFPLNISNQSFGRLAAQVAKQVIRQQLRDVEKKYVYDEYHERKGQIVTGVVQRLEKNNVIVKLGKFESVLPPTEQIPNEKFRVGDKIKLFVVESKVPSKNAPQILLSRANPGFVQKLFEIEVPEIADGFVLIKSIAREPGYRTKIAVTTVRGRTDPVGACIGSRGTRIKAITNELLNEKIDIVRWSQSPVEYISNALSPAKISSVKMTDRDRAFVVVPSDQLSLAIGKEGQNVRLAAKLTGFHIDIESESGNSEKGAEKIKTRTSNYED